MPVENVSASADRDSKPQPGRPQSHSPSQAAAAAGRRAGEAAEQQGRKVSEDIAHAGEVYRETTAFAADRIGALLSACGTLASGLQELQQTYLDAVRRSMEMASTGPRELMSCKNLSEMAELQREMLCRGLDEWFDSSSKLLAVSSRIAEDAIRPIEERVQGRAA